MTHHEQSQITPEQPGLPGFDPVEGVDFPRDSTGIAEQIATAARQRRSEVDEEANPRLPYIMGPGRETGTQELPRQPRPSKSPRKPLGHSTNEGSDSELDPYWNAEPDEPLSDEERAQIPERIAEQKAIVARANAVKMFDELQDRTPAERLAILRARAELQERSKGRR